jgi:hypothetical protein
MSLVTRDAPHDLPADPIALLRSLDGPTIFRVGGRDSSRTRIVSALVHGNEPSGLVAVHAALRARERPAVDVLFFLGAVDAAKALPPLSQRMLPGRHDLNRCFRSPFDGVDGAIAAAALDEFHSVAPEAIIDLHNNTGHNPPYGVGVFVEPGRLGLASLFATRFVHSTIALGALMEAFPEKTPVTTIECGRAGDPASDARAIRGLARFLSLERLPRVTPSIGAMALYVDPIRVEVAPDVTFAFAHRRLAVELAIDPEIDRHNFQELAPGSLIGWTRRHDALALVAYRADGVDIAGELFAVIDGALVTRRPLVPIMMTTNAIAARQDCLFYACPPLH